MSCERVISTFKEIEEVKIECCDAKEIESLENSIISSIEQKLNKINILIKNCNVYSNGKAILVNDRYNICSGIIEVSQSFGLDIKQIACSLRGKNYIISDKLLNALKQFDREFNFGSTIANQPIDEYITSIFKSEVNEIDVDADVLSMVLNIKKNGQFVTTRSREVTYEKEGGILVSKVEGKWISDADNIRKKLIGISKDAQNIVNKANENLRDGTAKLIYTRAKQMGYAVQEIKKGSQTQLVLVRCE